MRRMKEMWGLRKLRGLTRLMWLLYTYVVIYLEYHGNRLYGAMGVLSKKSDGWVTGWSGYPSDCFDY